MSSSAPTIRKSRRKRVPTNRLTYKSGVQGDSSSKVSTGKKKNSRGKASVAKSSSQDSRITVSIRKAYDKVKRIYALKRTLEIKSAWEMNNQKLGKLMRLRILNSCIQKIELYK